MRYEQTSSGKLRIVDPDKSPDWSDSLMLAVSAIGESSLAFFEADVDAL